MTSTTRAFPREPGVYALLATAEKPVSIKVGSWGCLEVSSMQAFVYVGSAMKGLSGRLARHLQATVKRFHWHVDYLLEHATVDTIVLTTTTRRVECDVSFYLAENVETFEVVPGFGNSDCRACEGHLYRVTRGTSMDAAIATVRRAFEASGVVPVSWVPPPASNE